jgi:nucleoside-specific outer membrane channel protein Tsx
MRIFHGFLGFLKVVLSSYSGTMNLEWGRRTKVQYGKAKSYSHTVPSSAPQQYGLSNNREWEYTKNATSI